MSRNDDSSTAVEPKLHNMAFSLFYDFAEADDTSRYHRMWTPGRMLMGAAMLSSVILLSMTGMVFAYGEVRFSVFAIGMMASAYILFSNCYHDLFPEARASGTVGKPTLPDMFG